MNMHVVLLLALGASGCQKSAASLRSTQGTRVVKVLDFGIAKVVAATRCERTREGLGTPLWMAPEQAAGAAVSPATDVWALGLIAFFLPHFASLEMISSPMICWAF